MTSRTPATAAALAGFLSMGLASADVQISVQYDATYSVSESRGLPCSGDGAGPIGVICPKAGDIAIANCQPYLQSYNGTACVAPMDAHCVLLRDDTWGCAFLKPGYTSEAEAIAAYDGTGSEGGTGNSEGVQVGDEEAEYSVTTQTGGYVPATYDTTLNTPLGIICGAVSKAGTGGTTTESGTAAGGYDTTGTKGGQTSVYGSATTVTTGEYGLTPTETVKGGKATGDYTSSTTKIAEGGKTTMGDHYATGDDAEETNPGPEDGKTHNYYGAPSSDSSQDGTDGPCPDTKVPSEQIAQIVYFSTDCPTDAPTGYPTVETTYPSTEETTSAPTDYPTDAPTVYPTEETTVFLTEVTTRPCDTEAPEEETTEPPTEEVTTQPPTEEVTMQPPTTQPPISPCTNQGTHGIGVENKVRYDNGAIYSSTRGPRNT